jgi:hypothetical protein
VLDAQRRQQVALALVPPVVPVTAGVAASFLIVALFAALTPALASSVPGDVLYPFKLALEQVELALAPSSESRASVHLTHADRRVQEALALVGRDEFNTSLIDAAVGEMMVAAQTARQSDVAIAQLQERTVQVNAALDRVFQEAERRQLDGGALAAAAANLKAARDNGVLLLPTPSVEVEPTAAPTSTPTETATDTQLIHQRHAVRYTNRHANRDARS